MYLAAFLGGLFPTPPLMYSLLAQSLLLLASLKLSLWGQECRGPPTCLPASGPSVCRLCQGTPCAEWLL